MLAYGLGSFWLGLWSAQRLYEPAIENTTQELYECSYLKDSATRTQIEASAHLEVCRIAVADSRSMLGTCKQVLDIADANTCLRPPPEPVKPKKKRKRRRWRGK